MSDPAITALAAIGLDRFSFTEAMRFIAAADADGGPAAGLILKGSLHNGFPAHEIERLEETPGGIAMTVALMGLTGALGALPAAYTDLLQRLVRSKDHGLRDLLDIFNGRLLQLLHEAHGKYRLPLAYGRPGGGASATVVETLMALIGLGQPSLRGRLGWPDERLLPFTAMLARRVRSAGDSAALMAAITGWPVSIEQFHGQWIDLPEEEQSRIGGQHGRPGVDMVAGRRVFDLAGGILLHVGPVAYGDFIALVDRGATARSLLELARFCVGPEIVITLRVSLRRAEVPALRLASAGAGGARLGWDSWLRHGGAVDPSVVRACEPS